jgi:hypothetical protein
MSKNKNLKIDLRNNREQVCWAWACSLGEKLQLLSQIKQSHSRETQSRVVPTLGESDHTAKFMAQKRISRVPHASLPFPFLICLDKKSVRRQLLVEGEMDIGTCRGSEKNGRACCENFGLCTFDVEVHSDESGRVGGYLALVSALVPFVDKLDLKAPVVGILEFHRVARVASVGVQTYRQQLQLLAGPTTHPRHLQHTHVHHLLNHARFFSNPLCQDPQRITNSRI